VRVPTPADAAPARAAGNSSALTVSVVIPAHNALHFVGEAIQSVLDQVRPALEVILVDDGSQDGTAGKVNVEFPQVRLLQQPHRGVSAARNLGWQASRGELIAFLDADDRYLPDKLETQVAILEKDRRLGLVQSGWRHTDAAGRPTSESTPWRQSPRLDIESWLLWKPVFLGGMLIRRSWLEAVAGFSDDLPQAEDVDLILRMALAGCRAGCKQSPWSNVITLRASPAKPRSRCTAFPQCSSASLRSRASPLECGGSRRRYATTR
jgi:glycosyltransferase involved in cell wall biosynthesis